MTFDLRVESRFKNAVLYKALRDRFESVANSNRKNAKAPIIRTAAMITGVHEGTISALLCLLKSPYYTWGKKKGTPTPAAVTLAESLDMSVEALFPPSLYSLNLPNVVVREMSSPQVLSLQAASKSGHFDEIKTGIEQEQLQVALNKAMEILNPAQRKVLEMRFGLNGNEECTYREAGEVLKLSAGRVDQIENKALRILAYHSRKRLSAHLGK